MRTPSSYSRVFIPLATVILLIAAFLRFWMLHVYPPGPHYDEAVYLLVSRTVAFNGARPFPILEAYQGREVLYFYLNWLPLALIQNSLFALHLTNAFSGMVIVASSMALGRLMFPAESGRWRGVIIGLAMGAVAAISFPQIWLARQTFRAVTLPLMQSLALVILWHGLRLKTRRRWLWLIVGGIVAGGAVYTYNSSRLFPFWLALGALVLLIADRRQWRLRLAQGAAFFIPLFFTALPMAIYAVRRPDIFFNRLEEVTQTGQSVTLWESILLHVRMFFIEGDPYLRYNIPGRPYFTLPEGLFLLIGIGAAVIGLVRAKRPLEKAAYALALLSPLMVIPSVISVGGLPPSHMRSLGMIPLIFVLVGIGFERSAAWLMRVLRAKPSAIYAVPISALMVLTGIGALHVGSEYFAWASRADVYYETDADLAAAGNWVRDHRQTDDIVYVAAKDRGHPTFMVAEIPDVTWLGTESLFRPPVGHTALIIFPRSAPPSPEWSAWLEPGRISDLPLGPDGRTAFEAFRISSDFALPTVQAPPQTPVHNGVLTLLGLAESGTSAASGENIALDMLWQVDAPAPAGDFTPLVQIEDANGFQLARVDPYMTETDRWRAGEVLFQQVTLPIPPATPQGEYLVRVAWVARAADHYQTYLNADGSAGGIWAEIGHITVTRPLMQPDPATLPIDVRLNIDPVVGVRLLGLSTLASEYRAGEIIPLTVYWQANPLVEGMRPSNWRVRAGNTLLFTTSFNPPAPTWQNGDVFAQRVHIRIPRELAAGTLPLSIGIGDQWIDLSRSITVTQRPRVMEAPPVDHPMDVQFGGVIRLAGYSVHSDATTLHVDLLWQALQTMDADYTVFVHVLNANGDIIAQRDAMPGANTYPTSLWTEGEFVMDSYEFPVIDFVSLRWGLYLSATNVRLRVTSGNFGNSSDSITIINNSLG
ncbi:MAG: hypothetical protein U0670_05300 [Anaerolineae bacterium]